MKSLLLKRYLEEVAPKLKKEFGLKNDFQVPRLEKIVVNVGMGSYLQKIGKKDGADVVENITKITGQKPVVKYARMSVSNFKLREGMPVGTMVTMRGDQAYNFLSKLINIVYPRVRGFEGVKRNIFDKNGNCSVGLSDHTVFPEIELEDVRKVHGVQVTFVFNTKDAEKNMRVLEEFKFPFKKK